MELYDMLHPMLELSASLPAIILCFLPMKNHLNGKGKLLLLWGIPTLILWCVGMGWLCWRFRYSTKLCMLLTQVLLLLFYCKAVPLSRWKTVNVFLAVCGVFSSMYNLAILIDALLFRRSGAVVLSLNSTILYVLLCWLLLGNLVYILDIAVGVLVSEYHPSPQEIFHALYQPCDALLSDFNSCTSWTDAALLCPVLLDGKRDCQKYPSVTGKQTAANANCPVSHSAKEHC